MVAVLIASLRAPFTLEELLNFVAGTSLPSVALWALVAYWPSAVILAAACVLVVRSREVVWIGFAVMFLTLQLSARLLGLFNGYPHYPWLLRELLAACLALGVIAVVIAAIAALPGLRCSSRYSRLALSIAALSCINVLLNWAFLLYFVSPLGATDT